MPIIWIIDKRFGKDSMNNNFTPIVKILAEDFEIPQLGKKRKITALLPSDYETTSEHYPVLYLQDGQNLFDPNAPFGNWGVDNALAEMAKTGIGKMIVVAIDHGGKERIEEYTPFQQSKFGIGQGRKYLQFVTETLKPHIDKNYRTLPDRANTGIGGSSMGGLISIYGGFLFPDIFGKLMIFSPSLWLMPNIHFEIIQNFQVRDTRIFLYAGGKESENMIPNVRRLKKSIEIKSRKKAKIDFKLDIDPDGTHSEHHWASVFPKAAEWLFFEEKLAAVEGL